MFQTKPLNKLNLYTGPFIYGTVRHLFDIKRQGAILETALYSSPSRDPRYITDDKVKKMAVMRVPIPMSTASKVVAVELKFGDTEIKMRVLDETGKPLPGADWKPIDYNVEYKHERALQVQEGRQCTLDLCFVIDCTGSMQGYIDAVKEYVSNLARQVTSRVKGRSDFTLRIGFVGYRDFCDGDKRLESIDFQKHEPHVQDASLDPIYKVRQKVDLIVANGGGDDPEDMMEGLREALSLQWTGNKRIIILIADAPCHGHEYHSHDSIDHRDCYVKDPSTRPESVLCALKERNIDLIFVQVVQDSTKFMLQRFKEIYDDNQGRTIEILDMNNEQEPSRIQVAFESQLSEVITSKLVVLKAETC